MNITIISCFRNATHYIERYFDQMSALGTLLLKRGDHLKLILGYGDSVDGTGEMLYEEAIFAMDALLIEVSHHGPVFGSIEHPQRFRQLAFVGNRLLDHVPANADIVGIVESDLIWQPEVMMRLIDHIQDYVAVAPMVMDGQDSFYDVFAFRANGKRFSKQPPYHRCFDEYMRLYPLESAGSVLFMDAYLARKARFSDGEAIVGFCRDIRDAGGSIWLDPSLSVAHPPYRGATQYQPDSSGAYESIRL